MIRLAEAVPPEILVTPEERERAVAKWETEIRPEISGAPTKSGGAILAEALQAEAEKHLDELFAARDAPVAVGEGLAKILAAYVEAEKARRS